MSAETLTLFEKATALCHRLLLMTSSDVYSMTVADLMSLTEGGIYWQYRWLHDPTDVHGPESGEQMEQWRTSGFWQTPADVRRVGDTLYCLTSLAGYCQQRPVAP